MSGLGQMGLRARAATPILTRLLDDEREVRVCPFSAQAPGRIGPEPHVAAAMGKRLGSGPVEVQIAVITALGELGPSAKAEVPGLLTAMASSDVRLRRPAVEALSRVGSATAKVVPMLRERLKDDDPQVSLEAVHALGRQGDVGLDARPEWRRLLADSRTSLALLLGIA